MLVHFDGACQPPTGPGIAAFGFTIDGPGIAVEECGLATRPYSEHSTNNVAEYVGAIRALERLHREGYRGPLIVAGDSQLVIRQMLGEYEVRAGHLSAYHDRLLQLAHAFVHVEWRWVPREENARADALSKQALADAQPDARRYQGTRPARRPDDHRPDVRAP
ncbi:MAG TPA: ribonuclease HI [Thermoplasmata archaeon]|nr:ribonuclease HI [Thermoplasmata archaeon]